MELGCGYAAQFLLSTAAEKNENDDAKKRLGLKRVSQFLDDGDMARAAQVCRGWAMVMRGERMVRRVGDSGEIRRVFCDRPLRVCCSEGALGPGPGPWDVALASVMCMWHPDIDKALWDRLRNPCHLKWMRYVEEDISLVLSPNPRKYSSDEFQSLRDVRYECWRIDEDTRRGVSAPWESDTQRMVWGFWERWAVPAATSVVRFLRGHIQVQQASDLVTVAGLVSSGCVTMVPDRLALARVFRSRMQAFLGWVMKIAG